MGHSLGRETEASEALDVKVTALGKFFETAAGPVQVLADVTLELAPGDAVAVVGPSGSGKSTLLHILGTLDSPSSGNLEIAGRNPFSLAEKDLARFRNRSIGFVFQDHHLLPQYSLLENVLLPTLAFPAESQGRDVAGRARQLLERVGLSHRLDHRPAQLSGGERQRAAIARALIQQPGLLLCDEPTGNLDRASAEAVTDLLFELHEREGNILVAVTHSEELASRFPRRLEMRDGRCVEA